MVPVIKGPRLRRAGSGPTTVSAEDKVGDLVDFGSYDDDGGHAEAEKGAAPDLHTLLSLEGARVAAPAPVGAPAPLFDPFAAAAPAAADDPFAAAAASRHDPFSALASSRIRPPPPGGGGQAAPMPPVPPKAAASKLDDPHEKDHFDIFS